MGIRRDGSRPPQPKNLDHLQELCDLMADPSASAKELNTLYAIRTSWATRGYLVDRELIIVRSGSTGQYISRAAMRSGNALPVQNTPNTPKVPTSTQMVSDGLPALEVVSPISVIQEPLKPSALSEDLSNAFPPDKPAKKVRS